MQRIAIALLCASIFTLGVFWVMHSMVSVPDGAQHNGAPSAYVDFVRLKSDSKTETKDRRRPEPPKPQKPAMPQTSQSASTDTSVPNIPMALSDIAPDVSGVSAQSFLGDAVVGMGFGDTDVIPLVRMAASYPQRALSQKLEGFVTARLVITPEGTVESVTVIEANPRGVFEREAIRALYRYKFKPKMENGRAVSQVATQTIEFKLDGQ